MIRVATCGLRMSYQNRGRKTVGHRAPVTNPYRNQAYARRTRANGLDKPFFSLATLANPLWGDLRACEDFNGLKWIRGHQRMIVTTPAQEVGPPRTAARRRPPQPHEQSQHKSRRICAASVEGATPAACDLLARRMTKGGVGDPKLLRRMVRLNFGESAPAGASRPDDDRRPEPWRRQRRGSTSAVLTPSRRPQPERAEECSLRALLHSARTRFHGGNP